MPRTAGAALTILAALLGAPVATAEGVKLRPGPGLYADAKNAALDRPEGVACSATSLVVADTGHGRFVVYELADRLATPKSDFQVPEVPYPIRVRLDAHGEILALDGKSRRIARLTATGAFQGFVGVADEPEPVIRSFAVGADGSLYVLDIAGERVLVTDPAGKVVRRVGLPAECRFPSDVTVDAQGRITVLDSVGARIFAAAAGKTEAVAIGASLKDDLAFATSLGLDAAGHLVVIDQSGGGIVFLSPDGSFRGRQSGMGWTDGLLRWPSSVCSDGRGGLYVADRENNRIAAFTEVP